MKKILHSIANNKGQFFMASTVVIIMTISTIFFYINSAQQHMNQPWLEERDISFFINNVKEEFGKAAELALSNVSQYKGQGTVNPADALNANLSSFSSFAQVQAYQNGILMNASYAVLLATNTTMNASVNITFLSEGSIVDTSFYAYRQIDINILTGTLHKGPATCSFTVTARKEFGEPLTGMTASNFVFTINDTNCASPSYVELGDGSYTFTCTSSPCVGSKVVANVTDTRNILSYNTVLDTGPGY